MYKLFLVEDEDIIRTRIRDNFDWEKYGFQFSGEAPDGEMALSLIEEVKPDIVVTDIKMPFMDGLQLSKLLKKQMPWVKIVIISGFSDFEYAKQAISVGVSEYILKPVKPTELAECLNKIKNQLDDDKKNIIELEKYEKTFQENLEILKERFLLETVMYGKTPAEIIEKAYSLELDLRARYYSVVVVRIDDNDLNEGHREYLETLKIEALIKTLISESRNILSCSNKIDETILIVFGDDAGLIESLTQNLADEVTSQGKSLISARITAGIGKICERLSDLKISYKGAVKALDFNFIFSEREVIAEEDISHLRIDNSGLKGINSARLTEFLKFARVEGIDDFLESYLSPLQSLYTTRGVFLRYTYINTILTASRFVEDLTGVAEETISAMKSLESDLTEIIDMRSLKIKISEILKSTLEFRCSRNFSKYQVQIEHAKHYIESNFQNPGLSLADAAGVANFSECRFSTIFKQETGYKFTEYLTKVRLAKAAELLKTTTKQAAEISEDVGYNDSHYFSYIFKKVNGITPTQFRDGIG